MWKSEGSVYRAGVLDKSGKVHGQPSVLTADIVTSYFSNNDGRHYPINRIYGRHIHSLKQLPRLGPR